MDRRRLDPLVALLLMLALVAISVLTSVPEAQAVSRTDRAVTEVQLLTRAAPTLATEGLDLSAVKGLRVCVSAASAQTLSGGGNLRAYYYDATLARWARNNDLDVAVDLASARDQCFPDFAVPVQFGRALWAADSVTVSGGTTVSVYVVGTY